MTLTGSVGASAGAALATGSLTFSDGPTVLGSAPLGSAQFGVNGVGALASLTVSTLSPGTHAITASFPGDANLDPATSALFSVVIGQPVPTSTFLSSSLNPSTQGQPVTFGITVFAQGPSTPFPSGPVTLLEGTTVLGTAQVASGFPAVITISSLAPGSHQIVASYGGDGVNFAPSTSQPVTQTVLGGAGTVPTSVFLTGPAQITFGSPATVTATVTSLGPGTPTGTIVFTTVGGPSATRTARPAWTSTRWRPARTRSRPATTATPSTLPARRMR